MEFGAMCHYSHNMSGSFFRCYGCGLESGDPKLAEPCPTPDLVGQARIAHVKKLEEGKP